MSSSNFSPHKAPVTTANLAVRYLSLCSLRGTFVRNPSLVAVVVLFLAPLCDAKQIRNQYTDQLFAEALVTDGLILVPKQTLPQCMNKHVCISARALLGAIHREYRIGFGPADEKRALIIAHRYHSSFVSFRNPSASENVEHDYNCSQLETARRTLAKFSDSQLRRQLRPVDSPLHNLYLKSGSPPSMLYAVAHVVLERGILVEITDNSGMLREVTARDDKR